MQKETLLAHHNEHCNVVNEKYANTINPPLYTGSTLLFDSYEDLLLANGGNYQGIDYGTDRLPPQRAFEDAMQALENGYLTRTFQSGINAIINTLLTFTRSGDHVLACENVYAPASRFCRNILKRYNIEVGFIPPDIGEEISNFIQDNTRLILLESPGSNTFEIQDIPAITAIARRHDIVTAIDNTWATPLYLDPFALGVDVSIQSVTKYIAGHSDVLLGTVTVNERCAQTFADFYQAMELFASPQDCYLALRGLRTLSVRLKQHEYSALTIASWLAEHPKVRTVIHPALVNHPQHHLWQRDFSGASGLFAFILDREYTDTQLAAAINALDLFGIGYSWGGFKSLITCGKYYRATTSAYTGRTIIRLNIGLENQEDLIRDLKKGLSLLP